MIGRYAPWFAISIVQLASGACRSEARQNGGGACAGKHPGKIAYKATKIGSSHVGVGLGVNLRPSSEIQVGAIR